MITKVQVPPTLKFNFLVGLNSVPRENKIVLVDISVFGRNSEQKLKYDSHRNMCRISNKLFDDSRHSTQSEDFILRPVGE